MGFPDSTVGKESTCNVGDPGSIPGSGRSTGIPIMEFYIVMTKGLAVVT